MALPALRAVRWLVLLVLLAAMFGVGWFVGVTRIGREVPVAALTDLERQFTERMRGAALVGQFTIAGREAGGRPERYEIASVEKVGKDDWRFNARIVYGNVDTTLPVVVRMVWADDTPIITMTDVTIPTMGTFSVRLLFYGDRYAGTWQHGKFGGHMFGQLEFAGAGKTAGPPAGGPGS
jgi:hypothetical protein